MASYNGIIVYLFFFIGHKLGVTSAFAVSDTLVDFSIGAAAGGCGAFMAYPIDYVKCQMQTESGKAKYKNGLDCFVRTVAEEGPLQLFRGVGVQLLGITPEQSIKLGVNDLVKTTTITQTGALPLWGELVAASLAGICQVIVTSPLESMKVALQTSDFTTDELFEKMGGIKGLFRGTEACVFRDIIFSAILFPIYHHGLDVFPPFVAGAMAGVAAAIVGTPPDFIKTRILAVDGSAEPPDRMMQDKAPQRAVTSPFVLQYKQEHGPEVLLSKVSNNLYSSTSTNPIVVGYDIVRKEGWEVMFTGVGERCFASIPRFGVTLSMYDFLKAYAIAHHWIAVH